jgi:hypothetical protein
MRLLTDMTLFYQAGYPFPLLVYWVEWLSILTVCGSLPFTFTTHTYTNVDSLVALAMASVQPPAIASPAIFKNEDVEMTSPDANGEEAEDPNKLPDNAIETLYVHNLNESVRMEGRLQRSRRESWAG